jgi:hypothetical protein
MNTTTTPLSPATYDTSVATTRRWRWLAAAAIFGNIGLTYWSRIQPFNGQTMGYVSGKYPTLLTPAGYAFSIWGIIFLALAAYAVWQLLPAQRTSVLPDAVAQPLTLANVATAVWVVLFAYEHVAWCALVMLVILLALIVAYGRARRLVLVGEVPNRISLPFALYLGWISVATVVNVTIGLWAFGWQSPTNVSVVLALGLLVVVTGLGLLISWAFSEMAYPLVVCWALVGIWVGQHNTYPELADAALVGAVVVAVGGFILARRKLGEATGV